MELGAPASGVVVVAGAHPQASVDPALFLQPLVSAVVEAQRPIAAAETMDVELSFVTLLRGDGQIDGDLVTVDNVDSVPGRVALVLGLHQLILSPGSGGDYGVKDGASGLVPTP